MHVIYALTAWHCAGQAHPQCGAVCATVSHHIQAPAELIFPAVISDVASYGALGHVPPSTSNDFILVHFGVNLTAIYCVVCEISWCRCQQLTAVSISTALVTKLLCHQAAAAAGTESPP